MLNTSESFREILYRRYRSELGENCVGSPDNPYLRRLARTHFPTERISRICDLGCGTGALLRILQDLGYRNLEGVDRSPFQVEHRLSGAVRLGDGLNCLEGKDPGSLEVIVTFDVIEHLTRSELLEWAESVSRVLAPGGRWIVHAPNAAGIFGGRIRYGDLTHEICFTGQSLRQLASVAGFKAVQVYEDKPTVHGVLSGVRRLVWEVGRLPFILLLASETGEWRNCVLSQNLTAVFYK